MVREVQPWGTGGGGLLLDAKKFYKEEEIEGLESLGGIGD